MDFIIADERMMRDWDAFVSARSSGHFMQSSGWGKLKEIAGGWGRIFFAAIENNEMRGASLVLSRRLPGSKKEIYYLPRGPVFERSDMGTLLFLLRNIRKYVKANNGIFIRVDPYLVEDEELDSVFRKAGFNKIGKDWSPWNCPRFIFWLKLDEGIDSILSRMKSKKRYEIRSAYKKGIEVKRGGGRADLKEFYKLMIETAARKNIGAHDYSYYENILRFLEVSAATQLFLAKYRGETAAAGISLAYGKRSWLLYLASSEEHLHLNANRALQFEMIKWAIEKGCSIYDFRGTATDDPPNPNDSGYGVYRFKKSFGPTFIKTVGYYDYVADNMLYKLFRLAEDNILPKSLDIIIRLSRYGKALMG